MCLTIPVRVWRCQADGLRFKGDAREFRANSFENKEVVLQKSRGKEGGTRLCSVSAYVGTPMGNRYASRESDSMIYCHKKVGSNESKVTSYKCDSATSSFET